jgi:hypothetical protein
MYKYHIAVPGIMYISTYHRDEYGNLESDHEEYKGGEYLTYVEDALKDSLGENELFEYMDSDEYSCLYRKIKTMNIVKLIKLPTHIYNVIWEVETNAPLNIIHKTELIEYIVGQSSDGWGEGFEQQPILELEPGCSELFFSPWFSITELIPGWSKDSTDYYGKFNEMVTITLIED